MFPLSGYLPQGSYLRIRSKRCDSSVVFQINGIIETDGILNHIRELWTPGAGGDLSYNIPIGLSRIHSLVIRNLAGVQYWSNYPFEVTVMLQGGANGTRDATLIQGFLDNNQALNYPALDTDPMIRNQRGIVQGTSNPAAGANYIQPNAGTSNWYPIFAGGKLVTEATVGNRNLFISGNFNATTQSGFWVSSFNMVAANTYDFSFNLNYNDEKQANNKLGCFLPDMVIANGGNLTIGAVGIKAADQFSDCYIVMKNFEIS